MLRKLVIALVAALALSVAPSAVGKEPFPGSVAVCGSSGCAELGPAAQSPIRLGVVDGSSTTPVAVAPAPYFLIAGSVVWVPSASALRLPATGTPVWVAALPGEESLLRDRTTNLRPYVPPTRPRVLIDFNIVKRTNSYMRLFTLGTPVTAPPTNVAWLSIWFTGGRTPWDDGNVWLWISSKGSLLKRDGQVLQIPPAIARHIRARLPLTP